MADRTRIEGEVNEVEGNILEDVGKATGDRRTEAEGILDRGKGAVEEGAANVREKAEDIIDDIRNR